MERGSIFGPCPDSYRDFWFFFHPSVSSRLCGGKKNENPSCFVPGKKHVSAVGKKTLASRLFVIAASWTELVHGPDVRWPGAAIYPPDPKRLVRAGT